MDKKLVGWKSIAAYFNRDRNTVARWAKDRGLPIHFIPGGKQRSVFAYESELKAWATRNADDESAPPPPAEAAVAPAPDDVEHAAIMPSAPPPDAERGGAFARIRSRIGLRHGLIATGAVLLAAAGLFFMTVRLDAQDPDTRLPHSPAAAADYVAARDAWALRTPEDLARAIQLYERVIRAEPGFAPARVGLAEAWLILREYGGVTDARAYGAARIAARKAISLAPGLASAHRAIGFIDYWWDNDPAGAVAAFQRALSLDDRDAQTHFWFANMLADLGQDRAAESHYASAKLLSPGSVPIAIEHACAQWQAGRDQMALRLLNDLRARHPADPTINNCLTWVHIGLGDMAGAARAYKDLARLRAEPELTALADKLDAAMQRDPARAHKVLIDDARREIAVGTRRLREVPAFYASAAGDRDELLALMHESVILGEQWYSHAVTSRIERTWRQDAEIMRLLALLRAPAPVLAGL